MRRGHQSVSLKHIMADKDVVLEGQLKYRDGKKWKSRWCIIRKLSPVADKTEGDTPNQDRLHLYLYKEFSDKYKDVGDKHKVETAKLHVPLQEFYGIESGFVLDKEHHVMAVLCHKEAIILAFSTRETLIQWEIRIRTHLGEEQTFPVKLVKCPSGCRINTGSVRLYIQGPKLCITAGPPPKLLAAWSVSDLRKFGLLDGKFCFDAGTKCGKCAGAYVFVTEHGAEITELLQQISHGRIARNRRHSFRRSPHSRYSMVTSPTQPPGTHAKNFTDCQVYADLNFMREEIPRSRTSSSVQPSSSTEYSSSPENPVLVRTQSLGNRHSPLRHIRSLTLKSERLRIRSSSDSPDPNRRSSKGSPKKSRKRESGLVSGPEESRPGTSPEEVVSDIQKSVDALSPKLCSKRKSNSTGSSPADSPALHRRNSQTCVFASHGQATRNSLELLDEVLKNCNVEEFSNSSSQSAGSSIKDLNVNSIRSSMCIVGSIAGTSQENAASSSDEMKTKVDYILSRKDNAASQASSSPNNVNNSQTTSPTATPALPQKTKMRRRSDSQSKNNSIKPLEYVDLSRFDGSDKESTSCWVKSAPVHSKSSSNLRSATLSKHATHSIQAGTIHYSLKRTKSCVENVSSALSGSHSNGIDSASNSTLIRRRQSLEGFLEEPNVSTVTIPCDISVPKLQSLEANPYCSLPPKTVKRPGNNVQLNSIPPVSCSVFVSSSHQGTAPSPSLVTPIPSTTEYLVMSGSGAPTFSQPKPATSDSGYIHMSHNPPATKPSSMPPYVNIAAYMELIQNIIRPKIPDYVNVPSGTGPIREEEPAVPVKVTTSAECKSMSSSTKPSYSIACCKCSCPPPVPDYVNISSIQPGTGVEQPNSYGSAPPAVVRDNRKASSHRSSPIPDYINVGPWLTKQTENIYANVGSHAAANCPVEEVNSKNKGTLNGHPPLPSNVQTDGATNQQSRKDYVTLQSSGESSTDLAYIARRHPNNTDDYMFITPGGRSSDRSTTVSPSSDYLSSLPLSPRSVFSTSSGSTSPRPYASPTRDYMMLGFDSDKDQKDGEGPVFSQVHLPIRRVCSMVSPSEMLSRSRKLSICSSDSGQQSQSSYMEMKPSDTDRKRSGKFVRSRSLKESSYHPRPQLMHSHSVDEEFEVSTYIVADIGSSPPNAHSDYMCMTPPGDDDDVNKSICDDADKPIKPFDNLIEPRHYVGSKVSIPNKPSQIPEPEVKNSPDSKPEQPKSLLSRIIRRNSTKDRKSILKTPDDSLSSPIESVAEVAEEKLVVHNSGEEFPFSGDPFGILIPPMPKDSGDGMRQRRFSKQWPEECNLTDEEKQSYSGLTPESPPALPMRKYKQMTESPAYMLMTPGGMIKNDHTASSSTLQPDDDDDSTSQIYIPSDEEDVEDLPPELPEKTRVYSAIGRMEGNDEGFAGTRGRTFSSSSENMLTDDLKFRSQTASPRMTLPRSKRETRLTIFVPRTAEMDDYVWLNKCASNTPDVVGDAGGDGTSVADADVSDTTSVCSYGSFSDSQSVYSDELNPRNTSTSQKPRFGLEYRRLDRRILENEPPTPNSPSVASSVFTFDASRLSSMSGMSIGTNSPHSPSIQRCMDHDYINICGPRSLTDSPRFYHGTPPGSPRSLSGISEISNPSLNYAEIDLSQSDDKRPRKPPSRGSDIEYAELDMLATAAASRAGKEHAQLREDSLRRKDRRTPLEDGSMEYIQRRHRKTSSSHAKERKSSSSRSGSKDRKFSSPM